MKKYIKFLLVTFVTQTMCVSMIQAKSYDINDFEHKLINDKGDMLFNRQLSPIFEKIEQATQEFYDGPYGTELCKATASTNYGDVEYSTGVSPKTAEIISNKCEKQKALLPKSFRKKYYVVKDTEKKLPIDSWTNRSNDTFLVIDNETTYVKLKELVAHELAFTLDSKFKLSLGRYNNLNPLKDNITDKKLKHMDLMFKASQNDYIAYLFGLMRAYQVEDLILAKPARIIIKTHEECAKKVVNYFNKYQNVFHNEYFSDVEHPLAATMAGDDFVGQIIFDKNSLADLQQDLNVITDPNPYFENSENEQVSFCQYMTEPLITAGSIYNIKAIGPRPRVGGGSDDGGSSDSEHSQDKVINDF